MTQLAVDTVLPPNDPQANGFVVVSPSRGYFFPDTAVLSTYGQYTVVRGYNGLFVFPSATTYVRRMSSAAALPASSIPAETDSSLTNAFASQSPRSTYGGNNDPCTDCLFAVLQSIDTVPGLDTEAATTYSPSASVGATNTTCGSTANCGISADPSGASDTPYAQNVVASHAAASSGGSCLLASFQYDTDSNTCVPATAGQLTYSSARRGTRVVKVGFAADYTWSIFRWVTTLTSRSSRLLYTNVLWDVFYGDVYGGRASGEGLYFVGADGQIPIRITNSRTWMSWTEEYFWNASNKSVPYIGFSVGVNARWTW
jgi:hypothetical protein